MVRLAAILLFSAFLSVTTPVIAGNRHVQPLPLNNSFEKLILLNAKSSSLRLFIPAHSSASSLTLLRWQTAMEEYSQKWQAKKGKLSDQQLVKELFFDTHRRFLKQYTPYAGLQALFEGGEYNCLSATAFYALLLDQLGYSYNIIESVNHIVLLVNLPHQQLLLESTDPVNGFVANADAIRLRLNAMRYQQQNSRYYNLNISVFSSIDLKELAGLQYFNYAAWYFNKQDLPNAAAQLERGQLLYKSERFHKVAQLLANRQ